MGRTRKSQSLDLPGWRDWDEDTYSLQMMTLQSSALPKTCKRFLSMFWVTLVGRLWMYNTWQLSWQQGNHGNSQDKGQHTPHVDVGGEVECLQRAARHVQ